MINWIKSEIIFIYYGWKLATLVRMLERGEVPDLTRESDTFLKLIADPALLDNAPDEFGDKVVQLYELAVAERNRRGSTKMQ